MLFLVLSLVKSILTKKEDIEAKKWFEKVVILVPENPMVYQYLGQIASDSEEYGLSEYYFNLAIKFHLQESLLFDHIRNVTKGVTLHEDVLKYYESFQF